MNGWVLFAAAATFAAVWGWSGPAAARLRATMPRGADARAGGGPTGPRVLAWCGRARSRLRNRRRERALRRDVAEVCELLAVCMEAGRPVRGAARVVAEAMGEPSRSVLQSVIHQIDLGVDEARAWSSLAEHPGYRGVARDISRSVNSGVALAELLRQHARDARRATAALAQVDARKAGVRSIVPLVLCFLPAFFLLGVAPIFGGLVVGR